MTYFKYIKLLLTTFTILIAISNQKTVYKTQYINLPVDHFGFTNNDTFDLRYLINCRFYEHGGPIFFYTGNEGDITMFAENTGLMWEWQDEFKAMIVFSEHRYYGKSLPYGDQSMKTQRNAGFLTSEQALADFVDLIAFLKTSIEGATKSPVIAFGGSYGGMLTAWLRMKYPNMVVGGLAASAPIWQFENLVGPNKFNEIVTKSFTQASGYCSKNIRKSWSVINAYYKDSKPLLLKTLNLCQAPKSLEYLKDWFLDIYTNLAMMNYPYATDFIQNLPAFPVKMACKSLDRTLQGLPLLKGVAGMLNTYFNTSGTVRCFNTNSSAVGSLSVTGWDYQACTEMIMPIGSNGRTDMFERAEWDLSATLAACTAQYGVIPRPHWVEKQYGGKLISATNIIFSNGLIDPWSSGGVMENQSRTVIAIVIEGGAHHLDLRSSNRDDPESVVAARDLEKRIIKGWIHGYNAIHFPNITEPEYYQNSWFHLNDLLSNPGVFIILVCVVAVLGTLAFLFSTSHKTYVRVKA